MDALEVENCQMTNEELKRVKHRLEAENSKILNSNKLFLLFQAQVLVLSITIAWLLEIQGSKKMWFWLINADTFWHTLSPETEMFSIKEINYEKWKILEISKFRPNSDCVMENEIKKKKLELPRKSDKQYIPITEAMSKQKFVLFAFLFEFRKKKFFPWTVNNNIIDSQTTCAQKHYRFCEENSFTHTRARK